MAENIAVFFFCVVNLGIKDIGIKLFYITNKNFFFFFHKNAIKIHDRS